MYFINKPFLYKNNLTVNRTIAIFIKNIAMPTTGRDSNIEIEKSCQRDAKIPKLPTAVEIK